jgi:hypothetical protein
LGKRTEVRLGRGLEDVTAQPSRDRMAMQVFVDGGSGGYGKANDEAGSGLAASQARGKLYRREIPSVDSQRSRRQRTLRPRVVDTWAARPTTEIQAVCETRQTASAEKHFQTPGSAGSRVQVWGGALASG